MSGNDAWILYPATIKSWLYERFPD